MRYCTPVYFQTVIKGEYEPSTGDYKPNCIAEIKRYADITSAETEALKLIYGNIKQGSFTIRLRMPYNKKFDRIRIADKLYQVDFSRNNKTFIISEVQ